MALIGNDFITTTYLGKVRCSECGKVITAGQPVLVSQKNGKVRKRICGEECRLNFDARVWQQIARKNSIRRGGS
jgi:hypothetical protein